MNFQTFNYFLVAICLSVVHQTYSFEIRNRVRRDMPMPSGQMPGMEHAQQAMGAAQTGMEMAKQAGEQYGGKFRCIQI